MEAFWALVNCPQGYPLVHRVVGENFLRVGGAPGCADTQSPDQQHVSVRVVCVSSRVLGGPGPGPGDGVPEGEPVPGGQVPQDPRVEVVVVAPGVAGVESREAVHGAPDEGVVGRAEVHGSTLGALRRRELTQETRTDTCYLSGG